MSATGGKRRDAFRAWALVSLDAFLALTCLVVTGATQMFDDSALNQIYGSNTEETRVLFRYISFAGSLWAVLAVTVAVTAIYLLMRKYWRALFLSASVGALWLIDEALKFSIARERPGLGSDAFGLGYSYPSGHTLVGMGMYFTIAILLSDELREEGQRLAVWLFAGAIVFLIGLSRLVLGVHYPTDVLGSALLGMAWTLTMMEFMRIYVRPAEKSLTRT